MKYALQNRDLWKAVTDEVVTCDLDQKARALIGLCVKDHHLATLEECASARAVWDKLRAIYQAKSLARRLMLRRELISLKKDPTEPLTVYVSRAKGIRDQLVASGLEIRPEEVTWAVLGGLPKEYDTIVTVLHSSDEEIELDVLVSKLLIVEQSKLVGETQDSVLYSHQSSGRHQSEPKAGQPGASQQGASRPLAGSGACWYCGKLGHKQAECRKRLQDQGRAPAKESGLIGREIALSAGASYLTLLKGRSGKDALKKMLMKERPGKDALSGTTRSPAQAWDRWFRKKTKSPEDASQEGASQQGASQKGVSQQPGASHQGASRQGASQQPGPASDAQSADALPETISNKLVVDPSLGGIPRGGALGGSPQGAALGLGLAPKEDPWWCVPTEEQRPTSSPRWEEALKWAAS